MNIWYMYIYWELILYRTDNYKIVGYTGLITAEVLTWEITPSLGGQIKDMKLQLGPKRTILQGRVSPDKMVKYNKTNKPKH